MRDLGWCPGLHRPSTRSYMKVPRKIELEHLQSLYKTDARIAEALDVPEYLVAYWRRKKGIPRFSAPKFTQEQVAELWARYGDDFRCGRELNISKAAFYSWRRKYEITDHPSFLKLEQLELRLPGEGTEFESPATSPALTATKKIWHRCQAEWPGAEVAADWRFAVPTDKSGVAVALIPGPTVEWPRSAPQPEALSAGEIRVPVWISPDFGSFAWQIVESRAVLPGCLLVGPSGTAPGVGGIACLALPVESARQAPRTIKIEITRKIPSRCDVEDIIIAILARQIDRDWGNSVVEFLGGPIEHLSLDRKVKLSSLAVAFGALSALCPFDDVIRRHFVGLLKGHFPQCHPDRVAIYDGEHFIEGRGIEPCVLLRWSDGRAEIVPSHDLQPGGALIGPDALPYEIQAVAEMLRGRRIAPEWPLLVVPATPSIYRLAQRRGWLETIVNAGGSVLDMALARRLGPSGLLDIVAAGGDCAYCTSPVGIPPGVRLQVLGVGSVLTVIDQLGISF